MNIQMQQCLICAVAGYLVGGLNPAYLLAKMKGFDIRTRGSGNAGASNATIVLGKSAGVICALFDIFKAFFVVEAAFLVFPDFEYAGIIAGTFCIIGHIFPLLMKFHGGKGLASFGGVVLAYDVKVFAALLFLELLIMLVMDYICIVSTSGPAIFSGILFWQKGLIWGGIFVPIVLVVVVRHLSNFRNIKNGVEIRIRYLWKKEEELDRVQKNREKMAKE